MRPTDDNLHRTRAAATALLSAEAHAQITRLTHAQWYLRAKAATALGQSGNAGAVEPLLAALEDAEPLVRSAVAEALGQIGDVRAVEPLCDALQDKSHYVRIAVAWALGKLGEARAVAPLCVVLQDLDSAARSSAAKALGSLGNARAVAPLCAALQDTDGHVRASAVRALGQIENLEAFVPLCAALQDADFAVRLAATWALRQLADVRAVAFLCAAMGDEHSSVRSAAAQALGKFGDVQAVLPLCTTYQTHYRLPNRFFGPDTTVKDSVALALWEIGEMPALPLQVLAASELTPAQKLDALEGLMQVSYQREAQRGEKPVVVRYALGSVRTFCEKLCRPGEVAEEEEVRCGAEAVLAELRNRVDATILLRASTRDDAREKQELLRGVFGPADTTPPDELLRPSETASAPMPARRLGFLGWIFRRR